MKADGTEPSIYNIKGSKANNHSAAFRPKMRKPTRKEVWEVVRMRAPSGQIFLVEREAYESCISLGWTGLPA